MSLRTRHWRQKWDPKADLVFTRRLRMGDNPKKPFVMPGDKVTKKMREKFGIHRLQTWFKGGIIAIADFVAPEPQRDRALAQRVNTETDKD